MLKLRSTKILKLLHFKNEKSELSHTCQAVLGDILLSEICKMILVVKSLASTFQAVCHRKLAVIQPRTGERTNLRT